MHQIVQDDDLIHFVTWQDCEPIIERNKRLQNEPRQRAASFHHIGSIPNVILLQWFNEEWNKGNTTMRWLDQEFMRLVARKLADPDWKWLRTV
jgi:hypothetical protein